VKRPWTGRGQETIWILRERHEANIPEALLPSLIQGGGMIMVWGAVWHGGRSQLVRFDCSESTCKRGGMTAVIYQDQVVKGPVLQAWKWVTARWRGYRGVDPICQDNAGPHKGLAGQEEDRLGMKFMQHSPNSSDLDSIEHCWAWMKSEVQNQERMSKNMDEHWERLQAIWEPMPPSIMDNCVDKLFERRKLVLDRKGYRLITYSMHVASW
jgi:hypothetical protein